MATTYIEGQSLDYFTDEERATGYVDQELNIPEIEFYDGELGSFCFVAQGPPGLGYVIRESVKAQLSAGGLTWYSVQILETNTRQFLGLPIYGNYKVVVGYHGSPLLGLAPILWAIFAILVAVGVTIVVWQVTQTIQVGMEVRKAEISQDIYNNMPTNTPEERAAKSAAALSAIENLTKPPPKKKDIEDVIKWGAIGGVVIGLVWLASKAAPSVASAKRQISGG